MTNYVLDSNIVSALIRSIPSVTKQFDELATPDNRFFGCPMVWHEVRRGLLAKGASGQMVRFEQLFSTFDWQDYTRQDWSLAAVWWVQRRTVGQPIGDADLLIAVFAHLRHAVLVTDNEKDFLNLGILVKNWMTP